MVLGTGTEYKSFFCIAVGNSWVKYQRYDCFFFFNKNSNYARLFSLLTAIHSVLTVEQTIFSSDCMSRKLS